MSGRVSWLERVIVRLLPAELAAPMLSDIDERYRALCEQGSVRVARRWRRRQLLACLRPDTLVALWYEARAHGERRRSTRIRHAIDARASLLDVLHGLRRMGRRWLVSLTAIVMVALGVSSFVFVQGVFRRLLHPVLRVPAAESVFHVLRAEGAQHALPLIPSQEQRALEAVLPEKAMAAYAVTGASVRWGDQVANRQVSAVSAGYFGTLGAGLALGRWPAQPDEAVIAHRYWQLLGAPALHGSVLYIDRQPFTVVGVLAREFGGLEESSVYLPLAAEPGVTTVRMALRVHEPADRQRLEAALASVQAASAMPVRYELQNVRERRAPLGEVTAIRTAIQAVTLLAVLLLVTVAANTSNLAGVEALKRARELAVRSALGASRSRIALQVLRETLPHAAGAAGLAVLLVAGWYRVLPAWLPAGDPNQMFALDRASVLSAAGLGALLALLTEVLPVMPVVRGSLVTSGWSTARTQTRARDALVVLQIVQCVALIMVAGLLARSQREIRHQPLGFDVRQTQVYTFTLPAALYDTARVRSVQARLLQQLNAAPGVTAALSAAIPVIGGSTRLVSVNHDTIEAGVTRVSAQYLQAMGTPLRQGRALQTAETGQVALISVEAARILFRGREAVGQTIRIGASDQAFQVAGVVDSGTQGGVTPVPLVLLPLEQVHARALTLIVRSARHPDELGTLVRATVRDLDPDLAVESMGSLSALLDRAHLLTRALSSLAALFGALGLLIGCLGVYAHFTNEVQVRHREIGIRLALGASMRDIVRALTRRLAGMAGLGLLFGTLLAVAGAYVLRALLFRTSPLQPVTLLGANLLIGLSAAAALIVPALRAARIAPHTVLRSD